MTTRLNLWGDPIPDEPIVPPPKRRYKKPSQPQFDRVSTDIEGWLQNNRPTTMSDFENLRTALYGRCNSGAYEVVFAGKSYNGDQRFKLTGPSGTVLIASDKARHFLLGRLRRIRGFMID
jgi:hypothetical protein